MKKLKDRWAKWLGQDHTITVAIKLNPGSLSLKHVFRTNSNHSSRCWRYQDEQDRHDLYFHRDNREELYLTSNCSEDGFDVGPHSGGTNIIFTKKKKEACKIGRNLTRQTGRGKEPSRKKKLYLQSPMILWIYIQ